MSTKARILGQRFVPQPAGSPDGPKVSITQIEVTNGQKSTFTLPTLAHSSSVSVIGASSQLTINSNFYISAEGGLSDGRIVTIEGQAVNTPFTVLAVHPGGGFLSES